MLRPYAATSIRVLVHETGSSKPLLKYLHKNYLELPIFDRVPERGPNAPTGTQMTTFFCPVSAKVKGSEVSLITELDPERYALSELGTWWANACMMLPAVGPVYRRELILGLANKEGGAHVDDDISEKYKNMLASRFFNVKVSDTAIEPVNVSRLVAGRAGVELLDCLDRNFPS